MNEYQFNNMKEATKETPVYAKLKLYEKPEKRRTENDMPYAEALVAVRKVYGDKQENAWLDITVLEVDELKEPENLFMPQTGTYMAVAVDHVEGNTVPESMKYAQEYNSVKQMRKTSPIIAHGSLFEETPTYDDWDTKHEFPRYDEIPETRFYWDLTGETLKSGCPVDSIWTAQMWILEHHPDYIFGESISIDCPSGDFMATAIPCGEYPQGMYENYENRRKYAAEQADIYGVKLGPREYDMDVANARLVPKIETPEEREQNEPQPNDGMTL